MIAKAKAAQALDQPKYEQCALLGEYKYNKDKPKAERRVDKCSYEWLSNGGPNSKGVTWRRLLPGACRQGNYVGPYGTDCCTGVQFEDGPKGIECTVYYPKP